MSIKKYIADSFVSRAYFVGSAVILNVLLAQLLGAAGSGAFYYLINNYSVFALVASFSLEAGIIYFVAGNKMSEKPLFVFSVCWTLAVSTLVSCAFYFFHQKNFGQPAWQSPATVFAFICGTLFTTYFSALFTAHKQFVLPLVIPASANILVAFFCAHALLVRDHKDESGIVTTLFFLSYPVSGVLLGVIYYLRRRLTALFHWPAAGDVKLLFRYSGLALLTNIIAFLALRIDYWIIEYHIPRLVSVAALGNYIQVSRLLQLFLFAPTIIAGIVFPLSAAGTTPEAKKQITRFTLSAVAINVFLCLFLIIFGKQLIPLVFGRSFTDAYMCFVFSVPAILSITVVRVLAAYFAGANLIKYNLVGGLIALVIITGLNFLLLPFMGINGAALADSAGYMAYLAYLLYMLSRYKSRLI